jgi:hypothetical protein
MHCYFPNKISHPLPSAERPTQDLDHKLDQATQHRLQTQPENAPGVSQPKRG